MSDGGLDEINSATDKLTQASHKLAEAMYKAQSAGPNGAPGAGGQQTPPAEEKPKDNVVDAEFVDVDDKK
jgi:molecular chaperone DnaK